MRALFTSIDHEKFRALRITHVAVRFEALIADEANDNLTPEQLFLTAVEDVELGFKGKVQVGLLFCFGRDMTHEANMILAEKTRQWRQRNVKIVGIDLAGHESINPLSDVSFTAFDSKFQKTCCKRDESPST